MSIDRIISEEVERYKVDKKILFTCKSVIDGMKKRYTIKYLMDASRWILFRS